MFGKLESFHFDRKNLRGTVGNAWYRHWSRVDIRHEAQIQDRKTFCKEKPVQVD
jgi:hypothetical protein